MTQLCVIPRCRTRGRHLDGCDDERCPGCMPRMAEEGLVCDWSVAGAQAQLADIIALTPAARLVAAGLVRRGTGGGGGGKPGSRSPGNDHATDVLDAVTNALTTIAREIADARGLTFNGNGRSRYLRAPLTADTRQGVPESTPDPMEAL